MEHAALLIEMAGRMALVLSASVVAALALGRLTISTSRNRIIYALVLVASGSFGVTAFADVIVGVPTSPWVVIGCLMSPVAWRVVVWVTWTPARTMYMHEFDQPGAAASLPRTQQRKDADVTTPNATPEAEPVFRTRHIIRPPDWPARTVLHVVPDGEHPH